MATDARVERYGPIQSSTQQASGPWQLLILPGVLLVAAAAALSVDCVVSHGCLAGGCPGFLEDLFDVVEPFGNGLGVVLILLVFYQLDLSRRWALPRLAACSLGAGLTADVVKMLVERTRPRHFDFTGDALASFGGWLPLTSAGSGGQSFPSAHTATAVGLAVGLAWLYPRGRWFFAVLAALVACQRVEVGAHFPSDVLAGAAVGYLVAVGCLELGRLPRWFDQWEARLGRPGVDGPGRDAIRPQQPGAASRAT